MSIICTDLLVNATSEATEFAKEVAEGLSAKKKVISSKWLYDDRGSEHFVGIMVNPHYYPTRCEIDLLLRNKQAILGKMPGEFNLVDLGAGDGTKSLVLLQEALKTGKTTVFVPIDISKGSNEQLAARLHQ